MSVSRAFRLGNRLPSFLRLVAVGRYMKTQETSYISVTVHVMNAYNHKEQF